MNRYVLLSLLCLLGFSQIRCEAAEAEMPIDYFSDRVTLLIDQVADNYAPPSINIGDPEKYYWPKAMARFHKYGVDDALANSYIDQIGTKGAFHFAIVGLARLLCLFPDAPAIVNNLDRILQKNLSAGLTTSEGTENHISMERTSVFLVAQVALRKDPANILAQENYNAAKEWILYWAKRVYQQGIGEWNSSTYATYSMIGWLNLYDFADDPQVQAAAKAVVDYYATEIALHYSWGALGGCEMRGNAETDRNCTATSYLGWLWFGTTPDCPQGFKPAEYIQSVHAALSSYRPAPQIIALAQKTEARRVWFQNSKPSYLYEQPSYCKQDFYISDNFTMGNLVCGYGGYTGASYAIVPWRLMIRKDDLCPYEIGGGGRYRDAWNGQSRAPFTQTVQYKNTLILLTRLPADFEAHYDKVTAIIEQWKIDWEKDYFVRQYPKDNVVNMIDGSKCASISYINLPSTLSVEREGKKIYVDAGNVYLSLTCLHTPEVSSRGEKNRTLVMDSGETRELTGYALEVIEKGDVTSWDNFKQEMSRSELILKDDTTVVYTTRDGDSLEATFVGYGTCMEPLFDWGYGTQEKMCILAAPPLRQPDWGYDDGFGKIPQFVVNGESVDYTSERAVYDGALLTLEDGLMQVKTTDMIYEVDYRGDIPEWKELEASSLSENVQAMCHWKYVVDNCSLTVQADDDKRHSFRLLNMNGVELYADYFYHSANISLTTLPSGCYLICIDGTTKKICL